MEKRASVPKANNGHKFEVQCCADEGGTLHVGTESLSVQIGQRVFRDAADEMWHSVGVYAREDDHGDLVIRVLVFNPDWEEPLQVASITSRPRDGNCHAALNCNLDHVMG